jgi:hypothetical protein
MMIAVDPRSSQRLRQHCLRQQKQEPELESKGLIDNGIEKLHSLLADIRTRDGGICEFLIDTQCDIEKIDGVMADETKNRL